MKVTYMGPSVALKIDDKTYHQGDEFTIDDVVLDALVGRKGARHVFVDSKGERVNPTEVRQSARKKLGGKAPSDVAREQEEARKRAEANS